MKTNRIGIFSGTFDPIHVGHVEACLVAKGALELDEILVMIEKEPRRKTNVTPYAHRKNMVELAVADFHSIRLYEVTAANITFSHTLGMLNKDFPSAKFVMIVGSDMLEHMPAWEGFEKWLRSQALAVVLRDNKQEAAVKKTIAQLKNQYPKLDITVLPAVWSEVSSSQARDLIRQTGHCAALHKNVLQYIATHKLYR